MPKHLSGAPRLIAAVRFDAATCAAQPLNRVAEIRAAIAQPRCVVDINSCLCLMDRAVAGFISLKAFAVK